MISSVLLRRFYNLAAHVQKFKNWYRDSIRYLCAWRNELYFGLLTISGELNRPVSAGSIHSLSILSYAGLQGGCCLSPPSLQSIACWIHQTWVGFPTDLLDNVITNKSKSMWKEELWKSFTYVLRKLCYHEVLVWKPHSPTHCMSVVDRGVYLLGNQHTLVCT